MKLKAIVLAAGHGKRMKSNRIKVAHHVAGKPILNYVIDVVKACQAEAIYVVIGHQADYLRTIVPEQAVSFVLQEAQLGTGHAVLQAKAQFDPNKNEPVLILAGDCPLIEKETIDALLHTHQSERAAATVLTTCMPDPASYGRIIRDKSESLYAITEAKDCTDAQLKINEINTGIYLFNSQDLFQNLSQLNQNNSQGEYYLTDIIKILKEQGRTVAAYCTPDSGQAIGVNTRQDLAQINAVIHQKINQKVMCEGVTLIDPKTTFIESSVKIEQDVVIHPFTSLRGETHVETGCELLPGCYLQDAHIPANTTLAPYTQQVGRV